jgi:hypothetical protein
MWPHIACKIGPALAERRWVKTGPRPGQDLGKKDYTSALISQQVDFAPCLFSCAGWGIRFENLGSQKWGFVENILAQATDSKEVELPGSQCRSKLAN